MTRLLAVFVAAIALAAAGPAAAWGDLGHKVTALIAYRHLTPAARARVDALLARDGDGLTAADFASRATWADKYREGHRETAAWHFVDVEIDHPDLGSACFGFPALAPGQLASQGPAQDCVVDKIEEFAAELRSPATPPAERLLAFKFLIHFAGDLHQPLHASDHDDRGGNCIGLSPSPDGHSSNLHAWWDTGLVEALGASAPDIAARLDAQISSAEAKTWAAGGPRAWAMELFQIAKMDVYPLPARPTCGQHGSVALSPAYQATARRDAAVQLEKAGVRMAALLNRALGQVGPRPAS
jgi:S1/P1 Nuclease